MIIKPIKYHILKPPFLLKGSSNTEFIYRIDKIILNKNDVENLSSTNIYSKIKFIEDRGGILKFIGCRNNIFFNNLIMIDSKMSKLLSEIMLLSYRIEQYKLQDVINLLENADPLDYKHTDLIKIYKYKITEFFRCLALGMNPVQVWNNEPNLYDHFPIIKIKDEIIYYSDSIKRFNEILISKTEIEKNLFGKIYFEEKIAHIKFNTST
ncbi:HpaII family restriction endonuclease [Flavobacterium sp. NRK1]|uniref:HpaII family restriction endonuclease n=1 Tax=Flavobacterium sp. NRK1 TaxID=2954929 RepID=UPI0020938869|nr:HpaII family restriction endonuclease [Flavobacterium sp. NRK1]MCO6147768.1 HpaII family restriction endonuclease [Flavobacterium sp. NRK1]